MSNNTMSVWASLPPFIEKYNMLKTIGRGSFSLVKECRNAETKERFAIKIIPKTNMTTAQEIERFTREVQCILKMNHPGIIKIHNFLADTNYFYLVMELFSGNTLVEHTPKPGSINEESAKPIFKQILEVVNYIHGQGIAHRDLKLENVLLDSKGHIKLIDFGFSRFASQGEMFATPCGSPAFAAPEIFGGGTYDGKAADMWSCGVILFCLVTGELPWKAGNNAHILSQIKIGTIEIPKETSKFCHDLLSKLLIPDPLMRLTAAESAHHPWFDGVEVSWLNDKCVKPVISATSFTKIIANAGNNANSVSPRSIIMKQIVSGPGSKSFGNRTPVPCQINCRFGPKIVQMRKESLSQIRSSSITTLPQ